MTEVRWLFSKNPQKLNLILLGSVFPFSKIYSWYFTIYSLCRDLYRLMISAISWVQFQFPMQLQMQNKCNSLLINSKKNYFFLYIQTGIQVINQFTSQMINSNLENFFQDFWYNNICIVILFSVTVYKNYKNFFEATLRKKSIAIQDLVIWQNDTTFSENIFSI